MSALRHAFRRLRGTIICSEGDVELPAKSPSPGPKMQPTLGFPCPDLLPSIDLNAMTIAKTWRDLPPEIVNHIVFILRNDLESLKACSLTCKALFISSRHLIHQRISLTWERNWDLLTLPERQRYLRGDRQETAVRVISAFAAHGLLPYGRRLFINLSKNFSPANLLPYNNHFQCLDRVHDLSIYWLHTQHFLQQFNVFFAHLVPTLRSLHLDTPTGDTRDILDFVCRFPHLDDLTLRMSSTDAHDRKLWNAASPPVVEEMPRFRGRLKLHGIAGRHTHILHQFFSLPGRRRFRFIDFRACPSETEQPVIDACCGTVETLSTTWRKFHEKGLPLNLIDVVKLRSLALRVKFDETEYTNEALSQTLHTITSPFFSEFILEVERVFGSLEPAKSSWKFWGRWAELDGMFERWDVERGFKVIIRAESVDKDSNFIAQAKDQLPLIDARGKLVFEIGPFPEKERWGLYRIDRM